MQFSNLYDNQLRLFQPGTIRETQSVELSGQWYEMTTFQGQNAVELGQQFMNELGKLQQIFESVLQSLNGASKGGCCLKLARLEQININVRQQLPVRKVEYEYARKQTYTHHEAENTNFFADGMVNTKDGRNIDFSFEMNLEREFFKEDQVTYKENGYFLVDPLVVNLDSTVPQLAQTRFSFDLDGDGTDEDLPNLMPGSGLLCFDKNHDGIINDGSELFGPTTGNGFDELSQYDLDHNLWIDENDAIFDELSIWENDEQGEMSLTKIKEAGIGAIYLANVQTPFDFRDENNILEARVKNSGIALNEDGSVSSIQEIEWTA